MNISEFNKQHNLDILHSMCTEYAKNKYNIDYNTSSPIYNSLNKIVDNININKYKFKNLLDMNKQTINNFDIILSEYKNQNQQQNQHQYNNSSNLSLDIKGNNQLYRPKEEYKNTMNEEMNKMKEELDTIANPPKPPEIDFTDKEEDNIDYKLKEELAKRELEYNSNLNSLPSNINDDKISSNIKIHHTTDIPLIGNKKNVSFNDNKDHNSLLNKLKVLSPINNNENNNKNKNNFNEFINFMNKQNEINDNNKQELLQLKQKIENIEKQIKETFNFTLDN